ncbi:MAG: CDP-alcohol phosphatidyltransferase family protein [Paracoccaceae bacterium]
MALQELDGDPGRPDRIRVAQAWAVHALTASGAVLGFLALAATLEGDLVAAFLWLFAALAVDGVDGTLARRVGVREATPQVDGAALDNVIDYFNYVAVPTLMLHQHGFLPAGWETPASALVMGASCWTFANAQAKSSDAWFVGFPATWNLVVLAFLVLGTGPWLNLGVVALCAALTFVPWKYCHPFRVRAFRAVTLPVTAAWGAATLWLLLGGPAREAAQAVWLATAGWFAVLTAWRSLREDPPSRP